MSKKHSIFLILFFVFAFCSAYYIYYEFFDSSPAPLLKANISPIKVKPKTSDDFRDNDYNPIYDQIKSQKFIVKKSKLSPLPERPMNIVSKSNKNDAIANIISKDLELEAKQTSKFKIISDKNSNLGKSAQAKSYIRGYFIQVATSRNIDDAEKEFVRISNINKKLISKLDHKIIRHNVEDKGVYFKLLIGPLKGPEHAMLLCKKLIQSKQTCIVKRL